MTTATSTNYNRSSNIIACLETESEQVGKRDTCAGSPNQAMCASSKSTDPNPNPNPNLKPNPNPNHNPNPSLNPS